MATVVTNCGLCADKLIAAVKYNPFVQDASRSRHLHTNFQRFKSSRFSRRQGRLSVLAVLLEPPPKQVQEAYVETTIPGPGPGSSINQKQVVPLERKIAITMITPNGAEMGVNDTGLESTMEHRFWVGTGAAAVGGMLTKAVTAAQSPEDAAAIGFAAVAAYILADLGTGVYHWGVDNFGDAKTPVFGSQIDAFQGHHKRPWTITKRHFANNIHAIARPIAFVLGPFLALPISSPAVDAFLGVFLGLVVMSQQFHAWAHMKKSQLPPLVVVLQDNGVLLPRKMHGAHHRSPYNINYCIVSGLWNPILDKNRVFSRLEAFIHSRFGVAPRSWFETQADWLQEGGYFEDGTEIMVSEK